MKRRNLLAAIAATAYGPWVLSQSRYPDRPIKMIIPFPPGGLIDVVGRAYAQKIEVILGQPVVIENRPGANTLIGTEFVAKAPRDGYTLLLNMTAVVSNAVLLPKVNYDPFKDFTPVSRMFQLGAILAVPPSGPKTLAEFIQKAKTSPKPLNYGTAGHASSAHYFAEMFARAGGFKMNHVPYKGEAQVVPELLTGRLDAAMVSGLTAMQYGKDGRVRPLAVSGPTRLKSLPDLPTFEELGVHGMTVESFGGIFAPAGTPADIVERLSSSFNKVMVMPDVQEKVLGLGLDVIAPVSTAEFASLMRKAQRDWTEVKNKSGIRLDE